MMGVAHKAIHKTCDSKFLIWGWVFAYKESEGSNHTAGMVKDLSQSFNLRLCQTRLLDIVQIINTEGGRRSPARDADGDSTSDNIGYSLG